MIKKKRKKFRKLGIEGLQLNTMKVIYDKFTANILSGEKLKIRNMKRIPIPTILIQYNTRNPSQDNQSRQINGIQIRKEEVKFSPLADDIIQYTENPKDSTKKLLELINNFSKVVGYKINIQKSVAFLYNNDGTSEKENLKNCSSYIASKTVKYLGISLTKKLKLQDFAERN